MKMNAIDQKVIDEKDIHALMMRQVFKDGQLNVIEAIDRWFKDKGHDGKMDKWDWEGLQLKLLKSKKRFEVPVDGDTCDAV